MNRGLRREFGILAGLASAGLLLTGQKRLASALGLCTAAFWLLPGKPDSFSRRSVLITGGSRGLGFALARRLVEQGAFVALLARDEDELNRAKKLLGNDSQVLLLACDVTRPQALEQAFMQAENQFGRVDILINNAGTISVGPFESMERADFDAQLELHLHGVIQASRLALPYFRKLGQGAIVNICSIGGMVPVPHMTPYCASKFALSGLSEAMAAELAPYNIKVTTVYPGMMRTGSPIQAVFKGNHEKEYGWFATGDVLPGLSVSADEAARRILEGVKHGDSHVSYPAITRIGIMGHAVFPEIFAFVARQAARIMPRSKLRIRKTGAASRSWLDRQTWYRPLKKVEENAEANCNQQEKYDAEFNMGVSSNPARMTY